MPLDEQDIHARIKFRKRFEELVAGERRELARCRWCIVYKGRCAIIYEDRSVCGGEVKG